MLNARFRLQSELGLYMVRVALATTECQWTQ